MILRKLFATTLSLVLVVLCIAALSRQTMAQADTKTQTEVRDDETNLDTQLYLIVGTNQEAGDGALPAILEPVVRQLRASLPFKNYSLRATLINRVKNDGRLNLRWVGGPLASGASSAITPSFSEFKVSRVKLVRDRDGQTLVRMDDFGFGARIPIQTSSAVASNAPPAPVFNYESTGLNTDISMREGVPVIVGTLNVGPSGDAIILVMAAKRTSQ